MIKSLAIAAVMTAFAGASFAQASAPMSSAPMSSDKPMAAASGSMGKHHAKKAHKAKSSDMAASAGMK